MRACCASVVRCVVSLHHAGGQMYTSFVSVCVCVHLCVYLWCVIRISIECYVCVYVTYAVCLLRTRLCFKYFVMHCLERFTAPECVRKMHTDTHTHDDLSASATRSTKHIRILSTRHKRSHAEIRSINEKINRSRSSRIGWTTEQREVREKNQTRSIKKCIVCTYPWRYQRQPQETYYILITHSHNTSKSIYTIYTKALL